MLLISIIDHVMSVLRFSYSRNYSSSFYIVFQNNRYRMPFAEAVLTESQRMWLVTPIIGPRRVLYNTILDGYKISKNMTVLMNIYCNNMDPEFFPDPTSFKPERYISKDGAYIPQENIILFGKGE